jgi:hypothetical protein
MKKPPPRRHPRQRPTEIFESTKTTYTDNILRRAFLIQFGARGFFYGHGRRRRRGADGRDLGRARWRRR